MRSSHAFALRVVATLLLVSARVRAGGGAATDAYDGASDAPLDVHGLADLYAQANLNAPSTTSPPLRAFDYRSDQPSVGLLHVSLAHKPDAIGFRLDAGVGDMANAYLHFDPAAVSHPGLSRALSYVEQAFATAIVPVGSGLAVDVGRFGTPVGLEENESLTNWNYSRSLLYLLGEPSFHAGARATYRTSETLALSFFWVNGWDATLYDGDGMRSAAAAATWDPTPELELVADYLGGLERAPTRLTDPTLTFRHELDGYVRYELTERVAFAGTADYGHDAASGGVSWWGVGGYLRVLALPWLAVAFRGEHYADTNGFTTGTKQQLVEGTATLEARTRIGAVTTIGRLEYRRDLSDARAFAAGTPGTPARQDTITAALIAAF